MDFIYNRAKKALLAADWETLTDTFKAMLVDADYVANADHDFVDDGASAATARPGQQELSGTGYASGFAGAGRKTLSSVTVTEDDTNDRAKLSAANLVWTAIDAGTAAALIVYRHLTSDLLSELFGHFDSGFPKTTNGGDLNANWHADGVATLG